MKSHLISIWLALTSAFTIHGGVQNIPQPTKEQSVLTFTLDQYDLQKYRHKGNEYTTIQYDNSAIDRIKGTPEIPFITRSLIIPEDKKMELVVSNVRFKEITVGTILPARGTIYRNENPALVPYELGDTYREDIFYPKSVASLSKPYIVRDLRGITVRINPFQYNPVKGVLRVVTEMTVTVKSSGVDKVNTLSKERTARSSSMFEELYRNHFVNYGVVKKQFAPVSDGDKMLIITVSKLRDALDPLIEWKNQKGITTEVVIFPDDIGGDDQYKLKKFIQEKYDTEKITYILLVGDHTEIPSFRVGDVNNKGKSDPTYVLLAGFDLYPDAFIGRFAGATPKAISVMVNKTIQYEKNPSGSHYSKAMGIASDEGKPTDKEWMDGFRETLLAHSYTTVDQIYDPDAEKSAVVQGVNSGRGWINYMGHGVNSAWITSNFSSSDVRSLTNGNRLPIVVSIACLSGQYDQGECFGEWWTETADKGAVAFFGSSINQPWVPPQHAMKSMIDTYLTKNNYLSLGAILYNGEMAMLDKGDDSYTFETWHLLGDPSLMPFNRKPHTLRLNGVSVTGKTLYLGVSRSIKGRIAVYDTDTKKLIGAKILNGTRDATFTFNEDIGSKDYLVTVTGLNCTPVSQRISEISINGGGVLSQQSVHSLYDKKRNQLHFYSSIEKPQSLLVKVFNSSGKIILSQNSLKPLSFRGNNKAHGVYIVQFVIRDLTHTKRIYTEKISIIP